METEIVLAKLQDVFRDVFDNEELAISRATTANDIEEWDSLAHITLIVSVEKAFQCKFTTSEVGKLQAAGANVGVFADMIASKTPL